jgi:hypothetical protein
MRVLILALVTGLAAGSAAAESLAERAAREKQKKENGAAKPARVFTDDDLKKHKPAATEGGDAAGATEATSAAETSGTFSDESNRDEQKESWRQRAKTTALELAAAKAAVGEVQARLDQLKSPFRATNPYGHGNPDVPIIEEELAQAKERLAGAEKARADFDREVAESRIPSRWLLDQ